MASGALLFWAVILASCQTLPCFLLPRVGFMRENMAARVPQLKPLDRRACLPIRCQISFADAVTEVLKKQFKEQKIRRVVDSWYKMDQDYIHREFIKKLDTWQEANSYIEGLTLKTFYDPLQYPWAVALRDNAKIIQDEFRRVALEGAEELEIKGNNVWVTAANATSAASYGPSWKTLALMDRCVWDDTNTLLFPETTRILREHDAPCMEAFFARMVPKSHINSHSDYCNFALTVHLGLDVPEGQCWMQVGRDRHEWRNGELLMFDTSIFHEADNSADRYRYILMLRVFHPDLTPTEVRALRQIFAYLDNPDSLDRDVLTLAPELLRGPRAPPPAAVAAKPAPASAAAVGGSSNRAARRGHKAAVAAAAVPPKEALRKG